MKSPPPKRQLALGRVFQCPSPPANPISILIIIAVIIIIIIIIYITMLITRMAVTRLGWMGGGGQGATLPPQLVHFSCSTQIIVINISNLYLLHIIHMLFSWMIGHFSSQSSPSCEYHSQAGSAMNQNNIKSLYDGDKDGDDHQYDDDWNLHLRD